MSMVKNIDQFCHIENNLPGRNHHKKDGGKNNKLRKNEIHKSVIELKFIINSKFLQFYRKQTNMSTN